MNLMDEFNETDAAYPLLVKYSGQRFRYKEPTAQEEQAVTDLVIALTNYEADQSEANITKVLSLLKTLGMTAHKVNKLSAPNPTKPTDPSIEITDKDNILFFHADDKHNGEGQLCFFWRLGAQVIPGDSSTYSNPVKPFIVSSLHEGGDGAGFIGLAEFSRLKAKILVLNGLHAHASKQPSPFQSQRNISDGAHSPATLTTPFLIQALRKNFPKSALIVVHGLGFYDKNKKPREMRLWFINSTGARFDLSKKSWPVLLSIAFAQQDFNFGEVSISGEFNDYFITDNNGTKRAITPKNGNYDDKSVYDIISGPTTDLQMHIVNNPVALRPAGSDSGRGVHIEHGYKYQFDGPMLTTQQAHLLDAFDLASNWYIKWDPRVHNFKDMPKDFRKFAEWFDSRLALLQNPANNKTMLFSKAMPELVTDITNNDAPEEEDTEALEELCGECYGDSPRPGFKL